MTVDLFITAGTSAFGALIAAWFGTKLGLRKFRQERAFEARLDWHRKLAETAKVLRNRMRAAQAFKRGGTPESVAVPLVKELGQLAFTFQELAEQASLYATPRTHAAIRDVLAQMTKDARPFAEYPTEDTSEKRLQVQSMYASSMAGLERVYGLLARDFREMLALEPLEEHRALDDIKS